MQLEHLLTDEQKDLRSMIRKFVQNEIMPVRAKRASIKNWLNWESSGPDTRPNTVGAITIPI